ncbi:MAG: esterase family protein [Clostridia bacterium]|nr:esterase family protein [Clostridia bacterium]
MKKFFTILCIMALSMLCLTAVAEENPYATPSGFDIKQQDTVYGKTVYHTYQSTTTGSERKCYVILPPNYDAEKAYPVLYLFHGIGGDHGEWMGGKPDVVVGNLIAAGEAKEMIIVTPNIKAFPAGTINSGGMYSADAIAAFDNFINDFRDDLMPFLATQYNLAPGRENTAVAGLSMGGREALYIGLTMQDEIGYIGAFCPAPGVLAYANEGGLIATEEMKVKDDYKTLIMIMTGLSDNMVGEWPQTYSDTLTQNGTENIFYKSIGGHDFFAWKNGLYNFAKRIFQD